MNELRLELFQALMYLNKKSLPKDKKQAEINRIIDAYEAKLIDLKSREMFQATTYSPIGSTSRRGARLSSTYEGDTPRIQWTTPEDILAEESRREAASQERVRQEIFNRYFHVGTEESNMRSSSQDPQRPVEGESNDIVRF